MKAIVFVANGLHAGWIGPFGNEWVETFQLDRLAAESIAFDCHLAAAPNPDSALRSTLIGRCCFDSSIESPDTPLPDILRENGVRSILVREERSDSPAAGTWDFTLDSAPEEGESNADALLASIEAGLDFLAEAERGLLWIETDLLLPPWDIDVRRYGKYAYLGQDDVADEEDDSETEEESEIDAEDDVVGEQEEETEAEPVFAEESRTSLDPPEGPFEAKNQEEWDFLHNSFAALVDEFDATVGRTVELFRVRGFDQSALWIFTSGFGYPLGEHGQIGLEQPSLHGEVTHLPLLMRLPGGKSGGRRIAAITQSIDLLPTLTGYFGLPRGGSLLALADGRVAAIRECAFAGWQESDRKELALRTPGWYLIETNGEIRLFEKPADRWEVTDLKQLHFDWAEHLQQVLHGYAEAARRPGLVPPPLYPPSKGDSP